MNPGIDRIRPCLGGGLSRAWVALLAATLISACTAGAPKKSPEQATRAGTAPASAPPVDQHSGAPEHLRYAAREVFVADQCALLPGFMPELDALARRLTEADMLAVQIVVHTDATGTEEFNRLQSQQRAELIADYLRRHGVASRRLHARGAGEAEPLSAAPTAEGRDLNRRVELVIGALSS